MMWSRTFKLAIFILLLCSLCLAQEVLPGKDYEKDAIALNEELRKLRSRPYNVIENRTSDPDSPQSGQIWLRTDL